MTAVLCAVIRVLKAESLVTSRAYRLGGISMTSFTFEFHSSHFDLLHATASLTRRPVGPDFKIQWTTGPVELPGTGILVHPYDGQGGTVYAFLSDLQVRRRADGRRTVIPQHFAIHVLTGKELADQYATILLDERVLVTIRVVDNAGQPARGIAVKILRAEPESWSIEAVTGDDGQTLFLAGTGAYSVVAGRRRHDPILVDSLDPGECTVRLIYEASRP